MEEPHHRHAPAAAREPLPALGPCAHTEAHKFAPGDPLPLQQLCWRRLHPPSFVYKCKNPARQTDAEHSANLNQPRYSREGDSSRECGGQKFGR